ncbi:MAG: peptide ABC transporter permease [Elusimicrobia bacterium RIFOXYA2_FULL_50_26]|nr:MAG: peptide ABC transporter permease [Elusimicrobia bacterium RIFOXYA2_FULL_50_26]OGS24634.1 MAG: peptide ABC transporter permease [Elusimicrobia bacterium RIFOXYB2_FULL_50_12]
MIKLYFGRFTKNKLAFGGALLLAALTLCALAAPLVAPYEPAQQDLTHRLMPPSAAHLLGTDDLGRDVFSRLVYGIRISLTVGFVAVGIATIIGTLLGIVSGYFGGIVDVIIMRAVDIMLCFPTFFLILLVIAFLEPGIYNVMIVIGLTSWPGLTRLVRAETLSLRHREFVQAAELLGLSRRRIFLVHILPNVISPVIVSATLGIADAILTESGLSFLGLGVQPPGSSWGQMLTAGKDYIYVAWWLSVFPGIAILFTALSFNLLGEGLRDTLHSRQ